MPKKMDRESVVFCLSSGFGWAVVGLGVGLVAVVGFGVGQMPLLVLVDWPLLDWPFVGLAIVGCPSLVGHRYNWLLGLLGLVVGFAWIGRWVCLDW